VQFSPVYFLMTDFIVTHEVAFEIKYDIGWLRSPHSKVDSAEMKFL
jgi:hypothetical protein